MLLLVESEELSCDEVTLFKFVSDWHNRNPTAPKVQRSCLNLNLFKLKEIASHLRLPLMKQEDLFKLVKHSKLVSHEDYVEALEFNISPSDFKHRVEEDVRFLPRKKPQVWERDIVV